MTHLTWNCFRRTCVVDSWACNHSRLVKWDVMWLWFVLTGRLGSPSAVHHSRLWCVVSSHHHHSSNATPHAGGRVRPLPCGVLRPGQLLLVVQLHWTVGCCDCSFNGRRTSRCPCTWRAHAAERGTITTLCLSKPLLLLTNCCVRNEPVLTSLGRGILRTVGRGSFELVHHTHIHISL